MLSSLAFSVNILGYAPPTARSADYAVGFVTGCTQMIPLPGSSIFNPCATAPTMRSA